MIVKKQQNIIELVTRPGTAQDALRAGVAVRWGHGDEAPDSIAAGHALSAADVGDYDGIGIGGRASSGAGPPPEPFMIARSKA